MSAKVVGCPYCHAQILLDGEHFGRMNECPECRGQFVAPPMAAVVVPVLDDPPRPAVMPKPAPRASSYTDPAAVQTQTTNAARRPRAIGCLLIITAPFFFFLLAILHGALVRHGIETPSWFDLALFWLTGGWCVAGLCMLLVARLRE
jgi:hypothetical protein